MKLFYTFFLAFAFSCGNPAEPKVSELVRDYSAYHKEALAFCSANGYGTDFYFLIDMSRHSGQKRFFVYNFGTKDVAKSGLVTHGSCDAFQENDEKYQKAKFSNAVDSHCTASGKYKVGKRDYSTWGIKVKYWLEGLEPTNSNARERVVVLHSWDAVEDEEIYPRYSPLSWGCPAVSDAFMVELDAMLQKSSKPVLLWIIM